MESFCHDDPNVRSKRVVCHFPAALITSLLGTLLGTLISFVFWWRLASSQHGHVPPAEPILDPLLAVVLRWLIVPWVYGMDIGYFFTGHTIASFTAGVLGMAMFYSIPGFVIDICLKLIRIAAAMQLRRRKRSNE